MFRACVLVEVSQSLFAMSHVEPSTAVHPYGQTIEYAAVARLTCASSAKAREEDDVHLCALFGV